MSKLGNGTFAQPLGITAGGVNYSKLTAEQQKALDNYVRGLGVPPGPPTQQGIYATPEFTGDPYPNEVIKPVEENQEPPEGWPRNPIFNAPGDVPGPPVQFGPPVEPKTVKSGEGFTGIGLPENDIFYFHPDHLGSTSYISSKNGSISQHVEYIAFGEVLFEEHSSSFSSPYLFNGKELDRETNLSYFGARYYDPKISLWLNIDPMMQKYPNVGSYVYTFNNPINLIDPDGMDPVPVSSYSFRIFANKLGMHGNQRIGAFFERLVIASLQTTQYEVSHNQSINFPSAVRVKMNKGLPGSVRPDGVTERLGADSDGRTFIAPAFYEAKATSSSMTKKYRKGQITGMIDAVVNVSTEVGGIPPLTLITTSNTKISKEIIDYASERNVMLYQSTAAIDDETNEFIISDRKWLNRDNAKFGKGGAFDRLKNIFDFNNYGDYDGVNPRNYIDSKASENQDPDPATLDDE